MSYQKNSIWIRLTIETLLQIVTSMFATKCIQVTAKCQPRGSAACVDVSGAFIYQLIHCDVARHANEICNRLKPAAAFRFFFRFFLLTPSLLRQHIQGITNRMSAGALQRFDSNEHVAVMLSLKRRRKQRKEKQCQLYYCD